MFVLEGKAEKIFKQMLEIKKIQDVQHKDVPSGQALFFLHLQSFIIALCVQVENPQQRSVEIIRQSNVWEAKQEAHFQSIWIGIAARAISQTDNHSKEKNSGSCPGFTSQTNKRRESKSSAHKAAAHTDTNRGTDTCLLMTEKETERQSRAAERRKHWENDTFFSHKLRRSLLFISSIVTWLTHWLETGTQFQLRGTCLHFHLLFPLFVVSFSDSISALLYNSSDVMNGKDGVIVFFRPLSQEKVYQTDRWADSFCVG